MSTLKVPVTAKDHTRGNGAAIVTLVEYGDYQCPDAGAAYRMLKKVRKHYGEKLRFVFRNFPLTRIHRLAEPAAEAAEFAASQGKFWEMHDALFENQHELGISMLGSLAEDVGLDARQAEEAVVHKQFLERITGDVEGGQQSGVHGTPTFFINGELYEGVWDYEDLVAAIDEAME